MGVELYRIDDRLIHGQVVVGWGQPLRLGFIVLEDLSRAARDRVVRGRRRARLSTHSQLVLTTTTLLLVAGFVLILLAQATEVGELNGRRVLDALRLGLTRSSYLSS